MAHMKEQTQTGEIKRTHQKGNENGFLKKMRKTKEKYKGNINTRE